ncbi:hypothetical protein KEM56_006095 [Ascosphaera pollenicola]|nr:hypothetical protein KEM56_006095 [Ascosphaera pollenicola]
MAAMAFKSKYAGLPDLDLAPDIYETPELTDDSTLPTSATVRSPSPFEEEVFNPEIDRGRLRPDEARERFFPARIDAQDVNFSDSIASKRKSYRSFTRARREGETGDYSDDDEEGENLSRKLARLKRETEELKEELERRKREEADTKQNDTTDSKHGLEQGLAELNKSLDGLHVSSHEANTESAEELLSQKITAGLKMVSQPSQSMTNNPTTIQPSHSFNNLLSNAAAFDERLTLLEAALGIPNTPLSFSTNDANESATQAILPTLSQLSSQLAALSSTLLGPAASIPSAGNIATTTGDTITTQHIEALTSRIRKLTADADALSSARRRATEAARAALAARMAAGTSATQGLDDHADNSSNASSNVEADSAAAEQAAKIQALYTTLPTITSLHPLLPSVLERLRSLRAIHSGAARASEDLTALEQRQAAMKKEIEQWREGLNVMEKKVEESEKAMKGNMEVMGPWVKELEGRVKAFDEREDKE